MKIRPMDWKRLIGLDNLSEEYKYGRSESTGYTSAQKMGRIECELFKNGHLNLLFCGISIE